MQGRGDLGEDRSARRAVLPAVECDGSLYVSGQVAQDPATGALIDGDVAAQTAQILRNAAGVSALPLGARAEMEFLAR